MTHFIADRRTDNSTTPIADHTACNITICKNFLIADNKFPVPDNYK